MAEGEERAAMAEDKESVKLFVGQVPKQMTEAQLLAMFKEFALVDEVNIIKDKATKASRGPISLLPSCFFAFFVWILRMLCVSLAKNPRLLLLDLSVEAGGGQDGHCLPQQADAAGGTFSDRSQSVYRFLVWSLNL